MVMDYTKSITLYILISYLTNFSPTTVGTHSVNYFKSQVGILSLISIYFNINLLMYILWIGIHYTLIYKHIILLYHCK